MELIGRMLDGSIPYDVQSVLRPSNGPAVGQDEKIERLVEVPIFAGCSRRQLRAVARIAGVFDAPAGAVLTRTGDVGREFFLILDGAARVEVSPRKHVRLSPGDFFGEMSLLDGQPRSATVVAETSVRLLVINSRNFHSLLATVPELTRALLVTLSRRLRQAEKSLNA
jgi:CRP/FNR family transcriptional regulator, cyclic AMP receptor protein